MGNVTIWRRRRFLKRWPLTCNWLSLRVHFFALRTRIWALRISIGGEIKLGKAYNWNLVLFLFLFEISKVYLNLVGADNVLWLRLVYGILRAPLLIILCQCSTQGCTIGRCVCLKLSQGFLWQASLWVPVPSRLLSLRFASWSSPTLALFWKFGVNIFDFGWDKGWPHVLQRFHRL